MNQILKNPTCVVQEVEEERKLAALVRRRNVPTVELAGCLKDYWMKNYEMTQAHIARVVDRPQCWVSETIGYLDLPLEVRKHLDGLILRVQHIRALKSLPSEQQLQVAEEVRKGTVKLNRITNRAKELMSILEAPSPAPIIEPPVHPMGQGTLERHPCIWGAISAVIFMSCKDLIHHYFFG